MPYGVFGGVQHRDGRRSVQEDFPSIVEMAKEKKASPEVLILAWMRQRFPCIVHITGARSKQHILDNAQSKQVHLTSEDIAHISGLKPIFREAFSRARRLALSEQRIVYLGPHSLSSAAPVLLMDFEIDMRQLATECGIEIEFDTKGDRLLLRGARDKIDSAIGNLDDIAQFYFERAVPK